METRLCVVGKGNGENKELMQAIEVNKVIGLKSCSVGTVVDSPHSHVYYVYLFQS